jgi:trans-aconitate methyltransferase
MSGRVETPVCMKNRPGKAFKWKIKARKALIFAAASVLLISEHKQHLNVRLNRST